MESERVTALCGGKKPYPMCERCLEEGFSPVTHGAASKTGGAYKRTKGGSRKKKADSDDDGERASSSSDEGSVEMEIAALPKKKEKAPPRAPTPTPRADPPPALFGVPPLELQPSPSGCSFGSSCKFQAAESTMTLKACSMCDEKKLHHLCCIENVLIKDFVGELGCKTLCLDCAAFLGVALSKTDGATLQAYFKQIDWTQMQRQTPLTLAALMSWPPRPILTIYEPFNSECEICDAVMPADDDDDAPALLQCSFCNLSFCNSAECLGKAGGAVLSKRHVENEEYEWSCPRCWEGALSKARRTTLSVVKKSSVAGKKTKKKQKKNNSKK
jgi:hypothetical protein